MKPPHVPPPRQPDDPERQRRIWLGIVLAFLSVVVLVATGAAHLHGELSEPFITPSTGAPAAPAGEDR